MVGGGVEYDLIVVVVVVLGANNSSKLATLLRLGTNINVKKKKIN